MIQLPHMRGLLQSAPSWVYQGASIDFDFANGRYYQSGVGVNPASLLNFSRASVGYAPDASGTYYVFGSGAPRITPGNGLLLEAGRTNAAWWCRDLTNAVWVATGMTAAKDQVGIDGAANSASSIAATAPNATILQTITLASSARWHTAFVKRLVGSGTVNMTMNGGTTWTPTTLTSTWTRVAIPTQTLANPSVGFQIVTSGDKIAVDFVQNEGSALYASSPIATTGGSAARSGDSCFVANAPTFLSSWTAFAIINMAESTTLDTASSRSILTCGLPATFTHQIWTWSGNPASLIVAVPGSELDTTITFSDMKTGISMGPSAGAGATNGGLLSAAGASTLVPGVIALGTQITGGELMDGLLKRVAVWPTTQIPNARLQDITRL